MRIELDDLPSELHELLAGMYEIMRRHEKAIMELITEVEAMRSTLSGDDALRFVQMKNKLQHQKEDAELVQLSYFDEVIIRLRDM
jgi:hypothetical protein